jgi:hypothetical protein
MGGEGVNDCRAAKTIRQMEHVKPAWLLQWPLALLTLRFK